MRQQLKLALGLAGIVVAAHAAANVTFYERQGFRGQAFTAGDNVGDLTKFGFNDRASSAVVDNGRWEVCEDIKYRGNCVVLRPGSYDSLQSMGLNNSISSVRPFSGGSQAYEATPPMAQPNYAYRHRPDERLYQANVTSVHAVVGAAEQRCWVERQQVADDRGGANVPGAIVGAVIGGVLGHQVGSGRGKDVATAGGAVAGAAIGANVGTSGGQVVSRDVQRCATVQNDSQPAYWDVTYLFRGVEHRVQLAAPPGPTIMVDAYGAPRV